MRFYIVDCFAEEKYQGNELAVLIPDREVGEEEMLKIAREINFSETAFILSDKRPDGGYDARIFTPAAEVPFAGHPTLGTAHIIHEVLEHGAGTEVRLNLKAGQIPVKVEGDTLVMTQNEPVFGDTVDPASVAECFHLSPADIRDDYPIQCVSTGLEAALVPLKSLDALARVAVDHQRFQRYIETRHNCNHLFFVDMGDGTLRARDIMEDPGFFEDPATGSANGNLAGYLLRHNFFGGDHIRYIVHQGVEMGRPSTLYVDASFASGHYTIRVGGKCFLVAEGDWK